MSLLNLPREIRDKIYNYVLISHTGHVCIISNNHVKSKHSNTPARISKNPSLQRSRARVSFALLTNPLESPPNRSIAVRSKRDLTSLSIRRVCRQTYEETTGVFWNRNQFYFPEFEPLFHHGTWGVFHTLKAMGQTASRMIVSIRIDMPAMSLGYRSFAKALNLLASRARHGAFRHLELVWGGDGRQQIIGRMMVTYMRYIQGSHNDKEDVKGFHALLDALNQAATACGNRYERVIRLIPFVRDFELSPTVAGASETLNIAFGGSLFWADKLAWHDRIRTLEDPDMIERVREQRALRLLYL